MGWVGVNGVGGGEKCGPKTSLKGYFVKITSFLIFLFFCKFFEVIIHYNCLVGTE